MYQKKGEIKKLVIINNEEKANRTSKIHTWKPKQDEIIVERDNKLFICNFDKVFGQPKLNVYNRFLIGKESYKLM